MADHQNVQRGLQLAANVIMANEPGDSRAVSEEAVALCALAAGDDCIAVMQIINGALDRAPVKPIDFRKILKSYMRYIARGEGITFVTGMLGSYDPEQAQDEALTEDERAALETLHREVKELEKDYLG